MQFYFFFGVFYPPLSPTYCIINSPRPLPANLSVSPRMFSPHAAAPGAKPLARQMALSGSRETHTLPEIPAHRTNDGVIEIFVLADTVSGMQSPRAPQGLSGETRGAAAPLPGGLRDRDG